MLQEVGILPTFVLVSIFLLIFRLKWWNVLRVRSGKKRPKTRRSSPRRGNVRLGVPKDKIVESLVYLSEGFARLGKGRLPLGEPVTMLRSMFMAYWGSVSWPGL